MTTLSQNVYFDVLDDIVNKYNNTVHKTIKMKPIDVTSDSYAEYNEDSNEKNCKFKVGDRVRVYIKKISVKGYTQKWSEEVFLSSTIKNTVPCTYAISEPSVRSFYEKVIKGKGDKLYVKLKGCDNLFNSWIKSKDLA